MPTLREALLPFTIRNAARLRFYAQSWSGIDIESISSTRDLAILPTLAKDEYRRSLMFDEEAIADAAFVTHTTGTTGPLTWRHRSVAEATVVHQLFGRSEGAPSQDLALTFRYDHHGMSMPIPGRVRSMPIGLTDESELKQCVQMLKAPYHFGDGILRPTIVAGSSHDVALLAQAWLEVRPPDDDLAIHTLHLLGLVDAGLHRFLAHAFKGTQIIEKYSLTEIFGGATRRWPSTSFVLDPYVIGEVLDERGAPVQSRAAGELVLTELFPFVQMQPLIRYRTGDVVLLTSDDTDNLQFESWGRRESCVLVAAKGSDRWVLGYRPVADWLSLQSLVSRQAHKPGLSSVTSLDFGPPCLLITCSDDDRTVTIDIGLRVNPWWERHAVRELAHGLWETLRTLAVSSLNGLSVRLRFRHMPHPPDDFSIATKGPAYDLLPTRLSEPCPLTVDQSSEGASHGT